MPWTEPLTVKDLHQIAGDAFDGDDPHAVAADLVEAVEQGRLAEKADTGFALILAAEITDHAGDSQAALPLAERAIEAYEAFGNPENGYPRAFRAELLLKLGPEDDAMAELSALRPRLTEDTDAVSYIIDALDDALRTRAAFESRSDPAYGEAATVAYALAQQRYGLRRDLGLPYDDNDILADRLLDAVHSQLGADEEEYQGTAVLFWPQTEFDSVLGRWPELAEAYGHSWDEHRARLERGLVLLTESSVSQLAVLSGSANDLAGYALRSGGDPTEPDVRQGYAEHVEQEHPRETRWPPGGMRFAGADRERRTKSAA